MKEFVDTFILTLSENCLQKNHNECYTPDKR